MKKVLIGLTLLSSLSAVAHESIRITEIENYDVRIKALRDIEKDSHDLYFEEGSSVVMNRSEFNDSARAQSFCTMSNNRRSSGLDKKPIKVVKSTNDGLEVAVSSSFKGLKNFVSENYFYNDYDRVAYGFFLGIYNDGKRLESGLNTLRCYTSPKIYFPFINSYYDKVETGDMTIDDVNSILRPYFELEVVGEKENIHEQARELVEDPAEVIEFN